MIDLVTHNSISIAAAPASIWPWILSGEGWKNGVKLVLIEGAADQPGALFGAHLPEAPDNILYHAVNVEIIPELRRTIRMSALNGTLIGFAGWRLSSAGVGATVEYDVYLQTEGPAPSSAEECRLLQQSLVVEYHNRFADELERLRSLVEG